MTQHRPVAPTTPPAPRPTRPSSARLAQPVWPSPRPADQTLPVAAPQPVILVAEVVLPGGRPAAPTLPVLALPGWTLRLWPVARLGDATLEARPDSAQASAQELRAALAELGIGVLGPLRPRGRT